MFKCSTLQVAPMTLQYARPVVFQFQRFLDKGGTTFKHTEVPKFSAVFLPSWLNDEPSIVLCKDICSCVLDSVYIWLFNLIPYVIVPLYFFIIDCSIFTESVLSVYYPVPKRGKSKSFQWSFVSFKQWLTSLLIFTAIIFILFWIHTKQIFVATIPFKHSPLNVECNYHFFRTHLT